jgi:hypothetical protein
MPNIETLSMTAPAESMTRMAGNEGAKKRRMMTRRITRWARHALAVLGSGLLGMAAAPQSTSMTGEAYGVYATTLTGSQAKAPLATVPVAGGMGDAEALSVGVPGVVQAEDLLAIATGAGDSHDASAEASSVAGRINILSGLITAEGLVAQASSAIHETTVNSNADGSHFVGLLVNGVALPATPAPNTQVALPGVGRVILNEQVSGGDGVNSTAITVNMIHVLLETTVTNLLGVTTTVKQGEIIVGSASSSVVR